VALLSLKDLGSLTYRRFLELFRHMVGLLGRVISPSQGLYLHRTTQHRKTRTNIHAFSGIGTHDPSNQPAKIHTSDRTASVTGSILTYVGKILGDFPGSQEPFFMLILMGISFSIHEFSPYEQFSSNELRSYIEGRVYIFYLSLSNSLCILGITTKFMVTSNPTK
jgi:hypothetical protein